MCLFNKLDKNFSKFAEEKTQYYRDKLGFAPTETTTHNNRSDAFKHMFTSATLTKRISPLMSRLMTNKHEWNNLKNGSPVEESIMDFNNNILGRNIGAKYLFKSELSMAKAIVEALNDGRAITSLQSSKINHYKNHPDELFCGYVGCKQDCKKFKAVALKSVK